MLFNRRVRAGRLAAPKVIVALASAALAPAATACLNDGAPTQCRCVMKVLSAAAAKQSFSDASPTLTGSVDSLSGPSSLVSFASPTPSQTVLVGTDTNEPRQYPTFYYYDAPHITINLGETVRWTQVNGGHTVTSDLPTNNPLYFDSGVMVNGQNFDVTFTVPGTYKYHCEVHDFVLNDGSWGGEQLGSVTVLPEPVTAAAPMALAACAMLARRRQRGRLACA